MSTAKFNTWQNPDGTENYKCRAWVNFNGTGTVAIRESGNVSSITDNGTGDYRVNFTTAMPDTNYCTTLGQERARSADDWGVAGATAVLTTSVTLLTAGSDGGQYTDYEGVDCAIFR